MALNTYTKSGNKATTATKLNELVFGVTCKNHDLLKQSYQTYLANGRINLSKTLRRGEVRGGGRKPWKQKGTGRARFGSIRVPIWRGGGITFGPIGEENYSKKISLSAKRLAIKQALSLKSKANSIIIIEDFIVSDGKTKTALKLLDKLQAKGRILIAVIDKTPQLILALRNLNNVILVQSKYLNTYNVLNADTIIFTSEALEEVHVWLGKQKGDKK